MICVEEKNNRNSSGVSENSQKRVTLNLAVSPAARTIIEGMRADTGVPVTTAVERFLEWLSTMPRKFRLAILQADSEGQQEMLIAWFKETMESKGKAIDITDADDIPARLRLVRQLCDEVEVAYARKTKGSPDKAKKK